MAKGTWQGSGTWQTTSGGGGGGWLGALAVILLVAAVARPVAVAARATAHVVAQVVEVTAIVAASLVGLAVLTGVGLGVRSVVRRHAVRAPARTAAVPQATPAVAELTAPSWPDRPALGAPQSLHLHLHGVDAEDVAAVLRNYQDGQ